MTTRSDFVKNATRPPSRRVLPFAQFWSYRAQIPSQDSQYINAKKILVAFFEILPERAGKSLEAG
jgi:hypothetical protein